MEASLLGGDHVCGCVRLSGVCVCLRAACLTYYWSNQLNIYLCTFMAVNAQTPMLVGGKKTFPAIGLAINKAQPVAGHILAFGCGSKHIYKIR